MQPPVADKRPTSTEIHGHTRTDDYEWLRDKESPDVTAYLEAENAWTQEQTAHLADLRQAIFDGIKARTRETDLSVPTRNRGFWYYGRSFEGKEYGASCRVPVVDPDDWTPPKPAEDTAPDQPALPGEQVLLDLDALAEGHEFFSLGGSSISPDTTLLAYSTDVVGDERYTIRVKDLATGELRPDEITGVIGGATWDRASENFYYTTIDDSWRADKIWRHRLGTAQDDDELVHHETDGRFWVGVGRTRSDRFLVIAVGLQDDVRVPLPRRRLPRRRLAGLRRAHRGARVLPRPRGDRRRRRLPGDAQPHRRRLRAGDRADRTDPGRGLAAADRPRPRRTPGGRGRVRRPPRRPPAQRGPDPAAHPRARRRRRRRRLPGRVRPRDLHGRLGRQPRLPPARRTPRLHDDGGAVVGLRLRRAQPRR